LSLGASTSTEGNDDTDATFLDIGTYCYRSTLVGADTDRTCAKCSARSSQRYGDRRSGHRSGYRTGRPRHRSGICQYGEGRRSSHGGSGKGRWNNGGKDRQRRVVHRYTRLCLLGAPQGFQAPASQLSTSAAQAGGPLMALSGRKLVSTQCQLLTQSGRRLCLLNAWLRLQSGSTGAGRIST
jgi:hypothetical protein